MHSVELPSITATHSNVMYPTRLDDVVKGLHCLFDGGLLIEPMALKEVDVIGLETFKGQFHRVEDVLVRQSLAIHKFVEIGKLQCLSPESAHLRVFVLLWKLTLRSLGPRKLWLK